MRVDNLARKARLEALSEKTDVSMLLFDYEKPRRACRIFLDWLKENGGRASKREISRFGYLLQQGKIVEGFKYSRKSFYKTVLRRLVDLGFIELYKGYYRGRLQWIYAPIWQPIPKRPPGGRNFYNMAWQICQKWNQEWKKF